MTTVVSRLSLVAALFLSLGSLHGAEERFWQLTFTYNEQGLSLLRAAQMPLTLQKVHAPGLNGAALRLEYDLAWIDAQGVVIHVSPVVIPLGGHTALLEDGAPAETGLRVPTADTFVVRVPGPADLKGAVQVRLFQAQAAAKALAQATEPVPPAFFALDQTFDLPLVKAGLSAAPGPLNATKIRDTGPDENRLVVVIEGDGFTAADLATGSFTNKAKSFLNALFNTVPWREYQNLVNVYRVDIESTESGADYADAAPENGGTLKDTYLNGGFWVGGTERCAHVRGNGTSLAMAAADELVGVGVWDEILVFLNSTKYGGCGGAIGVATMNGSSDEVQIHEFGHSFGHVGDEYDYGSTSTNCTPSSTRNIECGENFPLVKWQIWITNGTPIPTPDTSAFNNVVGAFQGAGYQTVGKYRPWRNCKMRSLGVDLCPVCKEAHVMKFFEESALFDGAEPAFGAADVPEQGTRTFIASPVRIAGLSYRWSTNGVTVSGATNVSFTVHGAWISDTNFELRVDCTHTTALVRAVSIANSNRWTLRASPAPALVMGDAAGIEGDSGETNLQFSVRLSYAHDQPVSVHYTTVSGTARAGRDFLPTNGVVEFAPGVTTNFIQVSLLGDLETESDEFFFVMLANPTNAVLGDAQGVGMIRDRDHPPVVTLTSPVNGAALSAPADVLLTADAWDVDGAVTRVEFFAAEARLGEAARPPFSLTWSNVPIGNYLLQAVATDDSARRSTSAPVSISVIAGAGADVVLIPLTNAWSYDASTNNLGTAWKDSGYDDSGWAGPSPAILHNESDPLPGPKNTQIPLTYNDERIRTFYFRTHFDCPVTPGPGLVLVSSNLIDDGAIFWLNGAEVARVRMNSGVMTRTSLASDSPPGGDATVYDVISLPIGNLRAGDNVMAVEVHQQSASSSDVVFGMALLAVRGYAPVFTDPAQPSDRTVMHGRSSTLSANGVGSPPPTYRWYRNGLAISSGTNSSFTILSMSAAQAGPYFLAASNALGITTSRVATVSYVADTVAPVLVYALANTNPTRMTVTFSEPIMATDANKVVNYQLMSTWGANLVISGASAQNGTNVLLTTGARDPNANYVLTVSNLRDASGNYIAANSTIAVATELLLVSGDGAVWQYFQSDGDPGPGWAVPGFADLSAWGTGPGLLDAKDPEGRVTVGPNYVPVRTQLSLVNPPGAPGQTLAYYFRTAFNLPGITAGARLRLRTLVDDGAIFYLNGSEVLRLRMPAAPAWVGYSDLATVSQDDPENIYEGPFDLPTAALRTGTNLLAVEVHQASATSSDLSFVAQLIGEVRQLGDAPFALSTGHSEAGWQLRWDDPEAVLEEAPGVDGPWNPVTPQPSTPWTLTPEGSAKFYRLKSAP